MRSWKGKEDTRSWSRLSGTSSCFTRNKSIETAVFVGLARIMNALAPGGAVWVYGAANIAAIVPVAGNVGVLWM